jgi:hypothetical protein
LNRAIVEQFVDDRLIAFKKRLMPDASQKVGVRFQL